MRFWSGVMHACGVLAALIVGAALVLVCYDVLGRNLGLTTLPWIVELTEYSLPLATLLAAPWLLFRFEHIRLDVLQQILSPGVQRHVDRLAVLVGLFVCLAVCWYGVAVIRDAMQIGALVMKTLVFPEWWLFVPVPVSFGLMAVECGRRLLSAQPGQGAHALVPGEED
ncbi:MAG: TRAP transporter small permease [Burkholderiales bacterium]